MSYYNTDEIYHQVGDLTKDVMARLDAIEEKIEKLIKAKENEQK